MNHSDRFLALLPVIEAKADVAVRYLPARLRDEARSEAIAAAFVMTRNVETLTADIAAAAVTFGIRGFLSGRRTGSKARKNDAIFSTCRETVTLGDVVISDGRFNPADLAATRIDFPAWLAQLPERSRAIAEAFIAGERHGEIAKRLRISGTRVTQIRQSLECNWAAFHGIEV